MATRDLDIDRDTWTEVAGAGESVDIQNLTIGTFFYLARSSSAPTVVGFVIKGDNPINVTGVSGEKLWVKANKTIKLAVQ